MREELSNNDFRNLLHHDHKDEDTHHECSVKGQLKSA